jgi:hypothetical protein
MEVFGIVLCSNSLVETMAAGVHCTVWCCKVALLWLHSRAVYTAHVQFIAL